MIQNIYLSDEVVGVNAKLVFFPALFFYVSFYFVNQFSHLCNLEYSFWSLSSLFY
jgi:hypothetical protein